MNLLPDVEGDAGPFTLGFLPPRSGGTVYAVLTSGNLYLFRSRLFSFWLASVVCRFFHDR
jgi:hypothetical protein